MKPSHFEALARGGPRPKPSGKDVKRIRRMLREGLPPTGIPFDSVAIDRIYSKLPLQDKQKIVKRVVEQKIEMDEVSEEQADKAIDAVVLNQAKRVLGIDEHYKPSHDITQRYHRPQTLRDFTHK
jgi:hypothetical protein